MNLPRFLILCYTVDISIGFFPNTLMQCEYEGIRQLDHTHSSITEKAMDEVVQVLLEDNAIQGKGWPATRKQALRDILEGSETMDRLGYGKAVNHFNGEQLAQGNEKLISLRRQIVELSALESSHHYHTIRLHTIRLLIGQCLHLIQDFYSNSDWIVKLKNQSSSYSYYTDLGVETAQFLGVDADRKKTSCVGSLPNDPSGNQGNILHSSTWTSSGYRSGQDIVKPAGQSVVQGSTRYYVGKCSHGGKYDLSAVDTEPRGGINMESYNYTLSPKYHQHLSAALSATAATKAFFYSDNGLSNDIGARQLSAILGVVVPQHVSFILTTTLQQLASTSERWQQALDETSLTQWSWQVTHLYTATGHKVGEMDLLATVHTTESYLSVAASQTNILAAASQLPENSDLILVTVQRQEDLGLGPGWDEDVLKKMLISLRIRLTVFVQTTGGDDFSALERVCLATGGQLYIINSAMDVINILFTMKPMWENTQYIDVRPGEVIVPVSAMTSLQLTVNCNKQTSEEPSVEPMQEEVSVRLVTSTDYTTVFDITSTEQQLLNVSLPPSLVSHCTVSTLSEQSWLDVYTVTRGDRDQLFPRPTRLSNKSKVVIEQNRYFVSEAMTPVSAHVAGQTLPLSPCLHDQNRTETRRTYITESSPDRQPDYVDVESTLNNVTLMSREYITMNLVEVEAEVIVPVNSTVIRLVVTNRGRKTDFTCRIEHSLALVEITPRTYSASVNEAFIIELRSHNFHVNYRPMTFLLTGKDQIGAEFHIAHTFHFLSEREMTTPTIADTTRTTVPSTHRPVTSTSSITVTTESAPPTNIVLTSTTTKDYNPNDNLVDGRSTSANQTATNQPNIPLYTTNTTILTIITKSVITNRPTADPESSTRIALSVLGTILCLVTPMVMIATALIIYHHYCSKNPLRESKSLDHIPVTSL